MLIWTAKVDYSMHFEQGYKTLVSICSGRLAIALRQSILQYYNFNGFFVHSYNNNLSGLISGFRRPWAGRSRLMRCMQQRFTTL